MPLQKRLRVNIESGHEATMAPSKEPFSSNGDHSQGSITEISEETPAPDGGWGWVIVLSSFMVSFLVDGMSYSFGVFLPTFLEYFESTKGTTSWAGSVLNGVYLTIGPLTSILANRFGCRKIAIIGTFIFTSGLIACTFCKSVSLFIFVYGGIAGCGMGMVYLPAIVMVGFYFEKKRALATGIAVCGSGIGAFVFAPLSERLLEKYGWQGATIVLSALILNCIVFSALYRPLEASSKKIVKPTAIVAERLVKDKNADLEGGPNIVKARKVLQFENKRIQDLKSNEHRHSHECLTYEDTGENNTNPARLAQSQDMYVKYDKRDDLYKEKLQKSMLKPLQRKDIFYSGSLRNIAEYHNSGPLRPYAESTTRISKDDTVDSKPSHPVKRFLKNSFDMSLVTDPAFAMYGGCMLLFMIGFFIPFTYLPSLALDMGFSSQQAAFLVSILGIASTIGRVIAGFISDQTWADPILINSVAMLIGGAVSLLVPFYKSYGLLAAYSAVFGLCTAASVCLRSIIAVELVGLDRLTEAFGLITMWQGLSSFVGSPIAGTLSDTTGNFNAAFYLTGATLILGSFLSFPLRRISKWHAKKHTADHVLVEENVPMMTVSQAPE